MYNVLNASASIFCSPACDYAGAVTYSSNCPPTQAPRARAAAHPPRRRPRPDNSGDVDPAPSASDLDGSSTGGATPVIITVAQAAWLGGTAVVVMGLLLCSVVYCNHRKHKQRRRRRPQPKPPLQEQLPSSLSEVLLPSPDDFFATEEAGAEAGAEAEAEAETEARTWA